MYRIEGDGSKNTTIYKDGKVLDWKECFIDITQARTLIIVDGESDQLEFILITGVYKIIGDGTFTGTRIFMFDEMLRGVQSATIRIRETEDPEITINAVLLPNLIEMNETFCAVPDESGNC